jgi:hypothetical protein
MTVKEETPEEFQITKRADLKVEDWMDDLEKETITIVQQLITIIYKIGNLFGFVDIKSYRTPSVKDIQQDTFYSLVHSLYDNHTVFLSTIEDKCAIRTRRKIRVNVITSALKFLTQHYTEFQSIIVKCIYPSQIGFNSTIITNCTHYLFPKYTFSIPFFYFCIFKGVIISFNAKSGGYNSLNSPLYELGVYSHRTGILDTIIKQISCTMTLDGNTEHVTLIECCLLGFFNAIRSQQLEHFHFSKPLQQLYENLRILRYTAYFNKLIRGEIVQEYNRLNEIIKKRLTKKDTYVSGYISKINAWLHL